MHCSNCNKQINSTSNFCKHCKSPINVASNVSNKTFFAMFYKGRLNRLQYFFWKLLLGGIVGGMFYILAQMFSSGYSDFLFLFKAMAVSLFIPITIKRLHDFNISGYFAIFAYVELIPGAIIATVVFNLFLLFYKGDILPNKYGPVPLSEKGDTKKSNRRLWIFISIFILLPLLAFLLVPLFT